MLTITVPGTEMFDESTQQIVTHEATTIELEHSLVSLSKWESIFKKPLLGNYEKTTEEAAAYVKAMTLTPEVPEEVFHRLSDANTQKIYDYINDTMTATWFNEPPGASRSQEIITAELIYSWLIAFQIPFETETWHLNKLFTLIRVCSLKNSKPKKMSASEAAAQQARLNAQRRAQTGSKG